MKRVVGALVLAAAGGCTQPASETAGAGLEPFGFEGVAYASAAEQVAHGQRLADVLLCTACHVADLSGMDFGEVIPQLKGLYATNISVTMPGMTDEQLERLLREGVHPSREALYVMPSKSYTHLTDRDMAALIAFLRTVPATGEPTPLPRLTGEIADRMARGEYHSAADEVEHYAANPPPDLGDGHRLGRYVAMATCTGCHGARMDGVGEFGGGMAPAARYDEVELGRFLSEGVTPDGRQVPMHGPMRFTGTEIDALVAYTKELAALQGR